jgi:enoyl-CoA hydratase/carnithine racemase
MALTERRIENSTVWIHLNYPAKKNPLRYEMYEEIFIALDAFETDD